MAPTRAPASSITPIDAWTYHYDGLRTGWNAAEVDLTPAVRAEIDAAVRAGNATLAVHQRVVAWRLWPDADFPRTHTFKIQRDRVRTWAVVDEPLPIREDGPSPEAPGKGKRR